MKPACSRERAPGGRRPPAGVRPSPPPLLRLPALPALGLHLGPEVVLGAVLAGELGSRPEGALADVARVVEQAPFAAEEGEDGFADRHVGDEVEGISDAAVDGVDPSYDVGVDFAATEGGDDV